MGIPKFTAKPEWLHVPANSGETSQAVMQLIQSLDLHTVCEEAGCPNRGECFSRRTATFLILGRECTRNCTFCSVGKGKPDQPDPSEPSHLAEAVARLALRYAVITSVTRDDLPDGGSGHFADVIASIKKRIAKDCPLIEVLIPDFQGDEHALCTVVSARPEVISHNIETVPRLYPTVRPQADYQRSLTLLGRVKTIDPSRITKSGIMVGLGETTEEVLAAFADLRRHCCDFLTIGQYLAPSPKHHPLIEYITPDQFGWYREQAYLAGFSHVASGPLVRSSYQAEQAWQSIRVPPSCHF